jgi:hypothetical protein
MPNADSGRCAEVVERREQFDALGLVRGLSVRYAEHEAADDIHQLLSWRADVMRVFESESFAARVALLSPRLAAEVLGEVTRLKDRLHATRIESLLRLGAAHTLERVRDLRDSIQEPFLRVLALVGIEPRAVERSESGLRELTITSTSPRLRVLFGLDPVRQRIIAILGEPLTRNYYGDSVRLAENRWAAYRNEQESIHSP